MISNDPIVADSLVKDSKESSREMVFHSVTCQFLISISSINCANAS